MIAKMLRKRRVLKLVHPGGFAEIHKSPITADEVMKKNPRHCVTRPDVFKYPWIVVRPESVLNIGSVFYIVPFHTIHCLLRRVRCPFGDTRFLEQQFADSSPVELIFFHELVTEQYPKASPKRSKVDCRIDDLQKDEIFPRCLIQDTPQCAVREPLFNPTFMLELKEFEESQRKQCSDDSLVLHRASSSSNSCADDAYTNRTCLIDDCGLQASCELQSSSCQTKNKVLKSCLKKENSAKPRGIKVKFAVPSENDEEMNMKTALKIQQKFP